MTFFYNLNKKLDEIRATPETTHGQLNERDEGKHNNKTTGFKALADKAAKEYGSKAAGERVAGAVRAKMAKSGKLEEEGMSRAAKGYEKYGKEGMEALAKAGREGKDLDKVRDKYNKYDESIAENAGAGYSPEMQARIKTATPQQLAQMAQELAGGPAQYQSELKMLQQAKAELSAQMEEGMVDTIKSGAQTALNYLGNKLGHGSDEDMIKKLQKDAGLPVTGKVPPQPGQQPAPGQQPMAEDEMEEGLGSALAAGFDKFNNAVAPIGAKLKGAKAFVTNNPKDYQAAADAHNKIATKAGTDPRTGQPYAHPERDPRYRSAKAAAGSNEYMKGRAQAGMGRVFEEPGVDGTKMTPKQKSFAALAEPKDKITFADKIAGAKKEVDEMLGDVAAEAMKNALRGKQQVADEGNEFSGELAKAKAQHKDHFSVDGKEYPVKEEFPTVAGARAQMNKRKVGDVTHGAKHDTEETPTGRRVTRRVDDKGYSVGSETDDEGNAKSTEKRGRGRPKSADKGPERVTAKATKHKGGRKTNEAEGEGDDMVKLAKVIASCKTQAQLDTARRMAQNFLKKHQTGDLAFYGNDMKRGMAVSKDIASKRDEIGGVEEEAVSKAQRRAAGIAHAAQKGEIPKSKLKGASKEMAKMPKGELNKFASTKEKGLPNKKEKTEETTVAGGMAPAAGGKSKAGSMIGKGIYDSLNRDLEAMIAESMNVSVNMSQDEHGEPRKSITINAEGDAAEQLAQLLNLAGMQAQDMGSDSGCGCETSPCSCEELDENQPDWPTDQETTGEDDPLMQRWSGGLNGPKSTGQAVDAPPNLQLQRQGVMGENKDLGMKLYAELKSFKG